MNLCILLLLTSTLYNIALNRIFSYLFLYFSSISHKNALKSITYISNQNPFKYRDYTLTTDNLHVVSVNINSFSNLVNALPNVKVEDGKTIDIDSFKPLYRSIIGIYGELLLDELNSLSLILEIK